MINSSISHIPPDSFTGAILAIEGIRDATVLLNGPTGCKFYHGAISDRQYPRAGALDPVTYSKEFYFGQPRVPATYLDNDDYVFGSTEKLKEILPEVIKAGDKMIGIINSPGAALIGDDLKRFVRETQTEIPCMVLEDTGFSQPIHLGFQESLKAAIACLRPERKEVNHKQINLVGLNLCHRHWEGSLIELRRLLGLCGIQIGAGLSAGSTVEDLRNLGRARLNVVVHDEFCDDLCPWLEEETGTPFLRSDEGAPIGYDATESWIRNICTALSRDPAPALEEIKRARYRSFSALSRLNSVTGLPKGASFAIAADLSLAYPLTKWLYSYLGMLPVAIDTYDDSAPLRDTLQHYLSRIGHRDAWGKDIGSTQPDVVFSDSSTISRLIRNGINASGIEICLPDDHYLHLLPKPLLGAEGALSLLERIINSLYTACCSG
ncbi:MAG: nitrogenase component 1 [Planctomycetota bacterium]|jgi:nitrogenase molybdenum-iron protein alpha/beta subunit|nr:nitrogenase component 1 [Planctomycetota bacterium]MDP7254048.1 nitrogenase component 1 [Planctomycetota bacterium]